MGVPIDRHPTAGAHAMSRWLAALVLAVAMFAFGLGVYHAAGYLRAGQSAVQRPNQTSGPALPGTIVVAQGGALYRFKHGAFTRLTSESGWTQPAVSPDGTELVVVRRYDNWSDLYLMTTGGRVLSHLINGSSPQIEGNHWVFYPRFSADGSRLFYDFDPKDPYNSYRVDLAIFASAPGAASQAWVQWTYPGEYTGGDVNPVPLASGGLIFTKFSFDDQSNVHSQLWLQTRPGSVGVALTDPALDCAQAAISADQKHLAMVCSKGQNLSAELDVATFDPATFAVGAPAALVTGQVVSSPTFSPDGNEVAYLAPATPGGTFQLWTVHTSGMPTPTAITTNVGLDPTSAPVWVTG
ncbi:MAG: TolB family protein [Candidatus Dormibacteraceae bacterium]